MAGIRLIASNLRGNTGDTNVGCRFVFRPIQSIVSSLKWVRCIMQPNYYVIARSLKRNILQTSNELDCRGYDFDKLKFDIISQVRQLSPNGFIYIGYG